MFSGYVFNNVVVLPIPKPLEESSTLPCTSFRAKSSRVTILSSCGTEVFELLELEELLDELEELLLDELLLEELLFDELLFDELLEELLLED